ncbi:MAG: hypothetical protein Unbinned1643contig1000_45 [Prokaryotic dsDNA virus sp.]|nr:MAG: hypothetical protein Unbinned1643contig1000_45 [Prokaryotic dsDNA virus sp.]|tara:strand:+ start:655 stop:780 length:126 start_codon:yes stop_codon:yes gene_type:complete
MIGLFNTISTAAVKLKSHIEKYWNEYNSLWEAEATDWDQAQ